MPKDPRETLADLIGDYRAGEDIVAMDAAHVDLRRRRALAGEEALGRKDRAEMTVEFEHIALANGGCDDLDHVTCP